MKYWKSYCSGKAESKLQADAGFLCDSKGVKLPYLRESSVHPFRGFLGPKNWVRIRIDGALDAHTKSETTISLLHAGSRPHGQAFLLNCLQNPSRSAAFLMH